MADNAGHGDRARAPRVAKIEIKQIVLDKLIAPNRHLRGFQHNRSFKACPNKTYCLHGTSGQMLGHGLFDGRLFGHTQDP